MEYGLSTCICLGMPLNRALHLLADHDILNVEYAALSLVMSSTNDELKREYLARRDARLLTKESIPTRDIRDIASSLCVSPVQVHSPDFDLGSTSEKGRVRAVARTKTMLEICSELGSNCLVLHAGDGVRSRALESFTSLAQTASDLGLKLAVENTWRGGYGSGAEDLREIVESTNPDHVCACIDTGHGSRRGIPPGRMVREIGSHLGATHIHDSVGSLDHLPPFTGEVDWRDFAQALLEVGYGRILMGEIEGSRDALIALNRMLLSRLAMERLVGLMLPGGRRTQG